MLLTQTMEASKKKKQFLYLKHISILQLSKTTLELDGQDVKTPDNNAFIT